MQIISSLNFHVAKAMLHAVENLQLVLTQANLLTYILAETERNRPLLEIQKCPWTTLAKLLDTAQNHTKNLELTLLEEIEMLTEFELTEQSS